ncbi:MBL fold metallo-hydrolase [Spirochaeta cellobiosiphila]|uniref:MBL fold metallo-hydrolase n=1 Tax=Spirochaeta cellobiosiphila TaxID=504483 RepID=UPI000403A53F|nr:MBL fold metallo-hydrolase [Spirochaeta cellobiosiphila]
MSKKVKFCIILIIQTLTFTSCITNGTNPKYKLSEELQISKIKKDTYLVTHSYPWPANSLLVLMNSKYILWIDTPYTPEATAQVLKWIDEEIGSGYSLVEINTGFHIDNLGGNQELIKRNIPIYGSELTRQLLDSNSASTMADMHIWLQDEKYTKYRDVYSQFIFYKPTHTFDINIEQSIKLGKNEAIIYYPGPTHTYDNLVVYLPKQKILFGGCMIFNANAKKMGYVKDGNIEEWSKSLEYLKERFPDIKTVIPGHGSPGDSTLIAHTKEIIDASK